MTIEDRLKALRRDNSREQAFKLRKVFSRNDPQYWVANALAFDWHRQPSGYAIASFKYAERLRGSTTT
jgi:hypothetical protein